MNVRRSDGAIVLRWVVLYYKNRECIRKRKGYSNMQKERLQQSWLFWKEGEESGKTAVMLPHDAMILEARCADCPNGAATGFLPGGKYVYETALFGRPEWAGQRVLLEFEGVYMNSAIFMNGKQVGGRLYGYSNVEYRFKI